jgi:UDP-3-O-[3-hydroxymyristoyl] glucosamine N-acyltransferase
VYGGEVQGPDRVELGRLVPLEAAGPGDLTPLLNGRFRRAARGALARGAALLVDAALASSLRDPALAGATLWLHPHAAWAMARVLTDHTDGLAPEPRLGADVALGAHVDLAPGVVLGDRVTIGASSVIGRPGFGWAIGPGNERVRVPQLGGVVIEDDVSIGPLVTIDAGTLGPTVVRRGVKLDAHVHIGHNCEVGEETVIAAQSGLAGSVKIGRRVLIGGQVGIADHVRVGDDARIAAKSGVIGDIPAAAVVAGYPAVARLRWLRGLATLYRRRNESTD